KVGAICWTAGTGSRRTTTAALALKSAAALALPFPTHGTSRWCRFLTVLFVLPRRAASRLAVNDKPRTLTTGRESTRLRELIGHGSGREFDDRECGLRHRAGFDLVSLGLFEI